MELETSKQLVAIRAAAKSRGYELRWYESGYELRDVGSPWNEAPPHMVKRIMDTAEEIYKDTTERKAV